MDRAEELGCKTLKLNVRGRRAWHDRMVVMPPNGRIELFEFKRPGEDLRPLQEALHDDLRAIGRRSWVFDDADRALKTLKRMMKESKYEHVTYPTAKSAKTEADLYEKIVGRRSTVLGRKKR